MAYSVGMDLDRIRQLVANTNASQASRESKVPLRTLMRFKADPQRDYKLSTLQKLEAWAKGRRLKKGEGA